MELQVRQAQIKMLRLFSKEPGHFALAGGTALELFYLKHRFSRDLDFFSPQFDEAEISRILSSFGGKARLENKFDRRGRARVHFYTVALGKVSVKIDFIQDVLIENPKIVRLNGVPVYDVQDIYVHKVVAITGSGIGRNEIGGEMILGRNEMRDAVDLYYLSQKVKPLHVFLRGLNAEYQRGMVLWYRTFSRQEFKLACLDLDCYDKSLDSSKMIHHLESEIEKFAGEL